MMHSYHYFARLQPPLFSPKSSCSSFVQICTSLCTMLLNDQLKWPHITPRGRSLSEFSDSRHSLFCVPLAYLGNVKQLTEGIQKRASILCLCHHKNVQIGNRLTNMSVSIHSHYLCPISSCAPCPTKKICTLLWLL